jgi:diacylglycerol kinase
MRFKSFRHAFEGIMSMGKNFCIMIGCFVLVVVLGFLFQISKVEWVAALLCCGGVLAFEMMNTAIENAVNLSTKEMNPLAKKAKDIAAGAVLVFSVFAAAVGMVIFLPHFIALFK